MLGEMLGNCQANVKEMLENGGGNCGEILGNFQGNVRKCWMK